jgi:D-alanine-D-alanine ligase
MVGREIDLAVLQLPDGRVEAAPALEIHSDPDQPFFNATAKYDSSATRFVVPAPLGPALAEHVAPYGGDARMTCLRPKKCGL